MTFQRQNEVLEMPNLIEVQKDSYQWFLDEGLMEVFRDISPIADYSGNLSMDSYILRVMIGKAIIIMLKIKSIIPYCSVVRTAVYRGISRNIMSLDPIFPRKISRVFFNKYLFRFIQLFQRNCSAVFPPVKFCFPHVFDRMY